MGLVNCESSLQSKKLSEPTKGVFYWSINRSLSVGGDEAEAMVAARQGGTGVRDRQPDS